MAAHGNDPPPNGFDGSSNPDIYGSGVFDFGWAIDGGATTWQQYNNGFNATTGNAGLVLTFPAGSLSPGCHTLSIQSRDRCGRIGPLSTTTLYVGPEPYHVISGYSTSFETQQPVAGDVITYGELCGPVVGQVTSDANGFFQTPPLPSGSYSLGAGSCVDVVYNCAFGNPIVMGCNGDQVASFRQRGLVNVTGASATGGADGSSISVTWTTGTPYTTNYRLYRSTSSNGPWTPIYLGLPPYVDGGMLCGQGYYYRVAAINGCAREGAPSTLAAFGRNDHCLLAPVAQIPANGTEVSLPEDFSWAPVTDANGYDLQIATNSTFSNILLSTSTTQTSYRVPASVAAPGIGCAWRIRATQVGYNPSAWSATQTFIRVTSVSPPGGVALLSPANAEAYGSSNVLFQWAATTGATTYRLEVSTTSDFGPGAALSWSSDQIAGTSQLVALSPAVTTVYWRVTAKNSAGLGPPSGTRSVTIQPSSAGVVAAAILSPQRDFTVQQGEPVSAYGLVVGRTSGTVQVTWLFDDAPLETLPLVLGGTGSETPTVAIPTGDIGTHSIQMEVSDGVSTLQSIARNVEIVSPGFGPPSRVVIVPDRPDLLAGDSAPVYCTIRDANDSIVLDDFGRQLHLTTAAGAGTVSPPDIIVSGGVAISTLTAGTSDAVDQIAVDEVTVAAYRSQRALALPRDTSPYSVSTTALTLEKRIAAGYIARLSGLNWNGIEGAFGSTPLFSFHLQPVAAFVNAAGPGDVAKLHRLNLILRIYDRSFSHNDQYVEQRTTPRGPKIHGVATLWVDASTSLAKVATGAFVIHSRLLASIRRLPFLARALAPALKWLAEAVLRLVDHAVSGALNHYNGVALDKFSMQQLWSRLKGLIQGMIRNGSGGDIGSVISAVAPAAAGVVAPIPIKLSFVNPLQARLNAALATLQSPTWNGGSDADAEAYAAWAIGQIRAAANHEHGDYQATKDAFDSQFVSNCRTLAIALDPRAGMAIMGVVEGLIRGAQGIDCAHVALNIAKFDAHAVDVLAGSSSAATLVAERRQGFNGVVAAAVRVEQRKAMGPNAGLATVLRVAAEQTTELETASSELQFAILNADTAATATALNTLLSLEPSLGDDSYRLMSPILATLASVRLDLADADANTDSLAVGLSAAERARLDTRSQVWDWLQSPDDESLRQVAMAGIQTSVDQTRTRTTTAVNTIPTTLGELGEPFLAIDQPSYSGRIGKGDSFALTATVRNLGTDIATNTRLQLGGPGQVVAFLTDSICTVGDLGPGESGIASWTMRLYPAIADSDSVEYVTFSVAPDSTSSAGLGRIAIVEVERPTGITSVSDQRGLLAGPLLLPNPSRAGAEVRFALGAPGVVNRAGFSGELVT